MSVLTLTLDLDSADTCLTLVLTLTGRAGCGRTARHRVPKPSLATSGRLRRTQPLPHSPPAPVWGPLPQPFPEEGLEVGLQGELCGAEPGAPGGGPAGWGEGRLCRLPRDLQ